MTVLFKSLGSILKVYQRSNLTQIWPKLCSKTILSKAKIFCVTEPGKYDFFGEMFDWVVEIAGRLVACLVLFLSF